MPKVNNPLILEVQATGFETKSRNSFTHLYAWLLWLASISGRCHWLLSLAFMNGFISNFYE